MISFEINRDLIFEVIYKEKFANRKADYEVVALSNGVNS
jgi:hypothetical protein